jgi:transcriptional regulator with XRE-family HTH domain
VKSPTETTTSDLLRRNIAARLGGRGKRPTDLAKFVGKTDGWISHVLGGRRNLKLDDLDAIAEFLEVAPSDLFAEPDDVRLDVFDPPDLPDSPPPTTAAGDSHVSSRVQSAPPSRIDRQQAIIEHQQDIIAHAVAHLKPLLSVLELFAKVEAGADARLRPTASHRPSPPRARHPRSASHR